MSSNVFIVNSDYAYERMFLDRGWSVVKSIRLADLVQFTGGEDVTPDLYGHNKYTLTYNNPKRDYAEGLVFASAIKDKVPMAGICRGGQFLNVMCGGWMWQDCNGHARNTMHPVVDLINGDIFDVTSTHHQMMEPSPMGLVIGVAEESGWKVKYPSDCSKPETVFNKGSRDVEIIHYPEQQVLCFQPHPEFLEQDKLADKYFNYLYEYLEVV